MASELQVAPLWRRFAAAVIDAVVVLVPVFAAGAGGFWLYVTYQRRRGLEVRGIPTFKQSGQWQLALSGAVAPLEIEARNWRSPGYRALGLRRVDASTGGPVSVRSAARRAAARGMWSQSSRQLMRPWEKRQEARLHLVEAEMEEVRRRYADDPEARKRALTELFKRHWVRPASSCLPVVASSLLPYLPAVWSPRHQSPPDRLAGLVVIRD